MNGPTLVGQITGTQVTSMANGNQGVAGTVYLNVDSTVGFTSVVATSSQYAFEFDNVAYSATALIPEPSTFVLAIVGALGMITYSRRQRVSVSPVEHDGVTTDRTLICISSYLRI